MRDDIVVHRPDGQHLPLIAWAAPVDVGGRGRPDAAVWVFEDLTALHQAEAARRESEARLRTVIETMAEGVIVIDEQGVVIECNPAASTILRIAPDHLRGPLLLDQSRHYVREDSTPLPPEDHPALVSLRSSEPVRNVVIGTVGELNGEGAEEARWLMVSAMPLPGPLRFGHGARVVATFADVTAYRRALDVVRASEEKYRELVETLPILLIQFDRAGRVVYMNPTAQEFTGFRLDELNDPERWRSMIWPQDLPQAQEGFEKALAGETARFEARYRAKDGTEKVGYVFSEPRHQDGSVIGVTALIVDMTRERKLEQELQRAQRLELIGRVASGIAHDFNNFLTVVLTLSELLRRSLPSDDPMQDDLRKIILAGEQAANLANQLLTFGKQRRVVPRRVDVNRVATRTLELLRATLPRSIQVEAVLGEGEMPVQSDAMQLQQVLMNLCLNARDAMPKGGCLEVRTSRGHRPGEWPNRRVCSVGGSLDSSLGQGQRRGNSAGNARPDFRGVLHHKGARHGSWTGDGAANYREQWRSRRGRESMRGRNALRRVASGGHGITKRAAWITSTNGAGCLTSPTVAAAIRAIMPTSPSSPTPPRATTGSSIS